MTPDISIDIEPSNIFRIGSTIRLNCRLPQSETIWCLSTNPRRRENNPLTMQIESDHINRRFICHAKDLNGKIYRKMIHIERYSDDYLTALTVNNEMERTYRKKLQQSTHNPLSFSTRPLCSIFSREKTSSNPCEITHASC